MNIRSPGEGLRKLAGWALLIVAGLAPAGATTGKAAAAATQFARAERLRNELRSHPAERRTRREYERAIGAYRRVYYLNPVSRKADPSVMAVADLLADMGRQFHDQRALKSAIEQYQFLRAQYPGSPRRATALFNIAKIYSDDLGDQVKARENYAEFVKQYPRNRLAEDAKVAAQLTPARKAAGAQPPATRAGVARVTGIRQSSTQDAARVTIALDKRVDFDSRRSDDPEGIVFDLESARLVGLAGKRIVVRNGLVKGISASQQPGHRVRLVVQVDDSADYSAFLASNPDRLIIDVRGKDVRGKDAAMDDEARETGDVSSAEAESESQPAGGTAAVSAARAGARVRESQDAEEATRIAESGEAETPGDDRDAAKIIITDRPLAPKKASRRTAGRAQEAKPTASGDRSLIRALGLKIGRIVIDPGHGGHDTGTIGPHGLEEKDVVLDVGRRLGDLLASRLGSEVVYTREDDTFIPLETRTAIANRQRADLFVSIHANSGDPDARGVETYYLNFTSSPSALEVAARENAASQKSIHELQDLVKKIALKEKIDESREFASDVQQALHQGLRGKAPAIRDRGVKKAPFVVLIGANMPSILAEISFVSNPSDERNLERAAWRQQIAESLYRGIAHYVGGLSGVKVASGEPSRQGQ